MNPNETKTVKVYLPGGCRSNNLNAILVALSKEGWIATPPSFDPKQYEYVTLRRFRRALNTYNDHIVSNLLNSFGDPIRGEVEVSRGDLKKSAAQVGCHISHLLALEKVVEAAYGEPVGSHLDAMERILSKSQTFEEAAVELQNEGAEIQNEGAEIQNEGAEIQNEGAEIQNEGARA